MSVRLVPPPRPLNPADATVSEREEMFFHFCDRLAEMEPKKYLARGIKKRWWQFFKHEHPATDWAKSKIKLERAASKSVEF